jgi:hypothetical protein
VNRFHVASTMSPRMFDAIPHRYPSSYSIASFRRGGATIAFQCGPALPRRKSKSRATGNRPLTFYTWSSKTRPGASSGRRTYGPLHFAHDLAVPWSPSPPTSSPSLKSKAQVPSSERQPERPVCPRKRPCRTWTDGLLDTRVPVRLSLAR